MKGLLTHSSNDEDEEQLEKMELENVRLLNELEDGDTLQYNLTEQSELFYNIKTYLYVCI